MAQRVTVRERIDPAITASLFANYRSSADAVMELVDNAIDSRIKGSLLDVLVQVHSSHFVIETRGGEGMGPAELERHYLRWGGSPKRGRSLLGQYGQGGKAAIGHLGTSFTVEASRRADETAWRFADADYRDRSKLKTYELKVVIKRVPLEQGYVRIRIDGVDKRLDPRRLSARLSDIYRPLIVRADLKISINGARVEALPINFREEHRFAVRAAGTTIRGWYGLAEPEGRGVDYVPGLRCYKLGRLIAGGEFFGHPNAVQVSGMAPLVGEVDLARVPLTMNKSDFARDGAEWTAVEQRMHSLLPAAVADAAIEEFEHFDVVARRGHVRVRGDHERRHLKTANLLGEVEVFRHRFADLVQQPREVLRAWCDPLVQLVHRCVFHELGGRRVDLPLLRPHLLIDCVGAYVR